MKVSINWLKELIDLKAPVEELVKLLPLRTIGTKEVTEDFIELDMKGYNRADLLSMRGVAYEVAAITNSRLKFAEPFDSEYIWAKGVKPKVEVEVKDEDLVPLYCVAKIEGLKVDKSSQDWIDKLTSSGIRSINNVADITNLIMLEYGQPMHAFDASKITDEKIIVRSARTGEKLTTLDNKERLLETNDLLITDPQNILGLAGVMGGKESEASGSTTTILLEAAIFDPKTIRKTSSRLNLPSEASKRFQHGLTKKRLLQALDKAIRMYEELGGQLTALTINGETIDQLKKIPVTLERVNYLIGVDISSEEVEEYLNLLNFDVGSQIATSTNKPSWVITPPYFRLDVEIEEDVIEEIARLYGYEKIPAKELPGNPPEKTDQKLFEFLSNFKEALVKVGLNEVQTYSFYSKKTLKVLSWLEDDNIKYLVKIANPISSETEYLRQNVWPNLVEVVGNNLRAGLKEVAIFEIGKAYIPAKNGLPAEQHRLSLAVCDGTDNPLPVLYKAFNESIVKIGKEIGLIDGEKDPQAKRIFHPTRFKHLEFKGKQIGGLAEVHPRVLNDYGIDKRVAMLEINLDELI